MFIKDEDIIELKVYYKKLGLRYIAYTEKEFDEIGLEKDIKKTYKVLCVKMRELTWGLYNELQDDAMVEDGNGDKRFNFKVYKENRLKKLLKEWDATNDDKPVSVNPSAVSHLAPSIAETILKAYDDVSFISEEEEGK